MKQWLRRTWGTITLRLFVWLSRRSGYNVVLCYTPDTSTGQIMALHVARDMRALNASLVQATTDPCFVGKLTQACILEEQRSQESSDSE